jgi:predicted DNA-binding protein (UPF0251 family)
VTCLDCGALLVSGKAWDRGVRPPHHKPLRGRGYCRADYEKRRRAGEFTPAKPPPRPQRKLEWVLEHWHELQLEDPYVTVTYAAEQMGMTRAALDQALSRARKLGDDRAKVMRRDLRAEADDIVLEDFEAIKFSYGSLEAVAPRLGLTTGRLEAVLARAAQRGDDRGTIPLDYRRTI